MTKVLGLVTFKVFPPQMGGQKGVALFYKYLAKYLDIALVTSGDNERASAISHDLNASPILFANRQIYANLTRLGKLQKLVKDAGIDAIISEHSYPAFMGVWLKRTTGKPFIIHSHNIEALRFKQMGRWWWKSFLNYERWVHRQADFNFFISEEDKEYALTQFGLDPHKCAVITYGTEQKTIPPHPDKALLKKELGFDPCEKLFLFNGTLDYRPNVDAVNALIYQVKPRLSSHLNSYKIVITGNRATPELIHSIGQHPQIVYRGFVNDIDVYYRASDLFLNPVINDSGVKTKVIEALANNCTVISFAAGATGVPAQVCADKLMTVADGDYTSFAQQIIAAVKKEQPDTPPAFYDYYNWDNIAQNAAHYINKLVH
jgi:polysaccharide biosynthesis protein PslH